MKFLKHILSHYWPLLIIILVAGVLFLSQLGKETLWDWDECIYAQYGKEMKQTGNYLTNQWNHILGFEKPPLYALLLQIPYLFGVNEFNARIISLLSGLLLISVVYVFSKKYFSSGVAIIASLLLLCSEVFVIYSMRANTDLSYSLFIFSAFYFWITSFKKSSNSYWAGVFFALAVMVKGLSIVSFLAAIFVSLFINYKKDGLLNYFKMIGVLIILILPWHLYQYLTYGSRFVFVYFYENLIKRANNPIEFHVESRLFYFKLLYRELFPWIFFLLSIPLVYILNVKHYLSVKKLIKKIQENEVLCIVLICIVVPLIAITRIQTRLPWYAIPLYPFLAIVIAYSIETLLKQFKLHKLLLLFIVFLILDAGKLGIKESKLFEKKHVISPRNLVFMEAKKYKDPQINYLVWRPEREAKSALTQSPNLYTSTTFIYGGNTCALYYSDKKINYYYSTDEFKKSLKKDKGFYVVENGDLWIIKDLPVKILYRNSDFTLFRT